jgi:TRAP-type mannitol/chloroaromatic compound transport system substrate-binding protein
MRIPGMGGEALRRAGGTPVTLPGGEIFTSLQTGAIDATEWIGPYNDIAFGLQKAAKYYYYPGWQEPGAGLECIINADAWNSLPADLQELIRIGCQAIEVDMLSEYTYGNALALNELTANPDIEIRPFPDDVLDTLKMHVADIINELSAVDPMAARIQESYERFQAISKGNQRIGEFAYLQTRE